MRDYEIELGLLNEEEIASLGRIPLLISKTFPNIRVIKPSKLQPTQSTSPLI